jgi:hypothetical protein
MLELARLLGGATLGAALGFVGAIYAKAEPGASSVIVVFFLAVVSAVCLIYVARVSRREFLDDYEDCQGDCKGKVQRRQMWRLPDVLPKKKGLAVCRSCFRQEMGGRSINPFKDSLAYAKKGEEHENTRQGKLESRERERKRQELLSALSADPMEQFWLSPEEKEMIRASQEDPQSPQSPKRGQ